MSKKKKGQYGYRDQNRRMRLALTLFFAAAILAQLAARHLATEQAAKNILTVMAILTVLPMANLASPLLASWSCRTPDRGFYERIRGYETKCVILYDLVVTTKEQILPLDAVAVHPNGVTAFCPKQKLDAAKAEKALGNLFIASRLDPAVKIIKEEKKFLQRLENLKPSGEYADDGSVEGAVALLKSLSM
ncbi:MAG: O-linked GlcNAc transferase-like protein [Lachnospiraceae bacterium]|nr:O-linked GlcNAc transferase-like protein [Lachnospiraceae bacterium]